MPKTHAKVQGLDRRASACRRRIAREDAERAGAYHRGEGLRFNQIGTTYDFNDGARLRSPVADAIRQGEYYDEEGRRHE